jgi:phenylpropionate dioxygenase-like ring-hydroxylating dioxygenase large terminal subunit
MAAWANELKPGAMLARRLLDLPVVLVRDQDDEVFALQDRCPHRFAPLSRGLLEGGQVVCGYHGVGFDRQGQCARNPHGPPVKSLAVRSYPLRESHRALWIWMGDPALADGARIPPLDFLSAAPDTAFSQGYLNGAGHYQLYVDNILDLTHADYLHPTTLGGGSWTRARAEVTERNDVILVKWNAFNENPTPVQKQLRPQLDKVDTWTEVEWFAPGVMTLLSGSVPAGTPREQGGNFKNVHIMTPESESRTHYFFGSTRDFALDDAELNKRFAETRAHIFATEDEPMIAAQYERLEGEEFFGAGPVLLNIDAGSARARRHLDQKIADEERRHAERSASKESR